MKRRDIGLLAMTLLAATVLTPVAGRAQDIQERTIRMSTANNKGHPQVMGAERFAPVTLRESEASLDEAEDAIAANPQQPQAYKASVEQANRGARWLSAVNATARNASIASNWRSCQ